jgi:predicted acyltransferase (DUF342 family)
MELLNNKSYDVMPDKLIIDFRHPLDIKTVQVAANQGTLKRGTVLSIVEPTLDYVVFGSALAAGQTAKANCIIADDVLTTATDAKVTVVVYISGNFNKNELIIAEGSTLDAAQVENLRNAGIFVTSSI